MTKCNILAAPVLALAASAAHAQPLPRINLDLQSLLTDYTSDYGSRREVKTEAGADFGSTTVIASLSQGTRKFDDGSNSAVRVGATLYQNWTDRFFTRTYGGISSDKPVFASREIGNDFNYKILPNAVVTLGGRYARYFGDTDTMSWSAGASYYFGRGFVTYRYTLVDVERLGNRHGHLVSLRLNDGRGSGSTQLWLGAGTSLHESELFPVVGDGKFRSATLRRVQPLGGGVSLNLAAGRSWFDTGVAEFSGNTATIGLSFTPGSKLQIRRSPVTADDALGSAAGGSTHTAAK